MVQEANVKRAQAEKALAESDMKVNTIQYSTSGDLDTTAPQSSHFHRVVLD